MCVVSLEQAEWKTEWKNDPRMVSDLVTSYEPVGDESIVRVI